jgi:hypothetical protein
MEKMVKTICLITLVLLVIVLPAAAIPTVIDQGVSTYDAADTHLIPKTTWKASEAQMTGNEIVAWIRIPPGSDVVNGYPRYGVQYRIFTPDGQDYLKDIWQATGNSYSRSVGYVYPINVGISKINLSNPVNSFKVEKYYSDTTPHEYGGYYTSLQQILPSYHTSDNLKPYQWAGTWKVEIYIQDNNWDQHLSDGSIKPRESTLASTQYFTIVDDTGPTPGPSNIPVSVSTTPITPPPNQKIIIEGENYLNANVKKTGASWDSTVEKCPTWRGTDWSGTGDYYLSQGGDTLTYAINAPATGKYVMWMRDWSDTTSVAGDRQVTIAIDGSTIGTYDAASSFSKGTTGYGWDKLTTVDLSSGSHTMTVTKKDTTSSAAIIDTLWFSSDLNAVPTGPISHSTALCTQPPTTTWTIVCTPPQCPSGGYITCPKGSTCSGGCGMVCERVPGTSASPSPIPMSPVSILGALVICGIIIGVMRRK